MREPILILGTPRSGTSMTAGVFHQHGVWVGSCRPGSNRNPKGFFENKKIKNILMERYPKAIAEGHPIEPSVGNGMRAQVEAALIKDKYPGGPWLWKGSVRY